MADLAGRPPLGPKPPKTPRKTRKPIPPRSKKRLEYLASNDRKLGLAHMMVVKALPCICCGKSGPSEAHHCRDEGPRDDMRVIPLCADCHRGPNGYHNAKAAWVARHGRDVDLLPMVSDLLRRSCPRHD